MKPLRFKPLKFEEVTEVHVAKVRVRYPQRLKEASMRAVEVLEAVIPVVEHYLDAEFVSEIRLDLLDQARASGVNPATGIIRHAVGGFSERSPRTAGLLSYQLVQVLWYRASQEARYTGPLPRLPSWLLQAALLPILYSWSSQNVWLDYIARQISLCGQATLLTPSELHDFAYLDMSLKPLANAQALLRGQSITYRHKDWIRDLCATLAKDTNLEGYASLEKISQMSKAEWEKVFLLDLHEWFQQV